MSANHDRSYRTKARASFCVLALAVIAHTRPAAAALDCPSPQPDFAYVDADNDGCYTSGVDSSSIDAALKTAAFVAPPGTGVVIPHTLVLPNQANPHWSVENDIWIDGRVNGPSELVIEAGGTTTINGYVRMQAQGEGYEGDTTIGCATGCGPVVIADRARVTANGYLTIYDATIGDDVRIVAPCAPGGDPSCYAWLDLVRPASIGDRFKVRAPGGVTIRDGTAPLVIGDDVNMKTKSVFADGGTIGFDIYLNAEAGLTIGANARLAAGGSVDLGGVSLGMLTGPLTIGTGAKVSGTGIGVFLGGSSVDIGAGMLLRAKFEIDSAQQMPVGIASAGPLSIASDVRIYGGGIIIDSGIGAMTLDGVAITSGSRSQFIGLYGESITLGPGSVLTKSKVDGGPILVNAGSAVSIASSTLSGEGLEVSVSSPTATIAFTNDDARGGVGTVARFTTPGDGSCDLSGSTFLNMSLDTSTCGSVIGP